MPPKKIAPMVGEQPLDGIPVDLVPPPILPESKNLTARNAFSRLATPEYWGLDLARYADITPKMIDRADPPKFRKDLIDTPVDRGFAAGFLPLDEPYTRVALTPTEYGMITRSPKHLGKATVGRALAKQIDETPSMVDRDRASRHGQHLLEAMLKGMQAYVDTLDSDTAMLQRFREAATYHWYSRGQEATLRTDMQWIHDRMFGNMFAALRYQRGWTPEKEDLARRALEMRLFFRRSHNMHTLEWVKLFDLNLEHTGYKKGLFGDRIVKTKQIIEQPQDS